MKYFFGGGEGEIIVPFRHGGEDFHLPGEFGNKPVQFGFF